MKRVNMILVMLILIASQMTAQLVRENEAAIVYYMPKNELCLTLDYSIIEQTPGVFYQYAERYLGTTDVIKASQTSYILNSLSANLVSTADTERAYKITATQSVNELLISLTQDGRLLGYNIGLTNEIGSNDAIKSPATHTCSSITEHELMPLLEEQFIVSSVAKMAEGAAKQIYRIRETRLNLLAGEVEHVPADGEAMKLVLAELDHQEKLLTELFVGKKTVTHKTHTLSYIPIDNTENEIVCRFSVHSGVVAADDLSGEPIYLNVQAKKQELGYIAETNSKAPALSQLYYNIPGEGKIHITYKGKDLLNASYPIAQWGMAVPMNKQLFMGRQSVTIHINPETGNILSIQQ